MPEPRTLAGPFLGFSSAATWKVDCGGQSFALKRLHLPERDLSRRKSTHVVLRILHITHQLPVALPRGLVCLDGGEWECLSWRPGSELCDWGQAHRIAAGRLLGRLHRVLAGPGISLRPGRLAQLGQSKSVQTRVAGLSQPVDFQRGRSLLAPLGEFFSRVNPRAWRTLGEECSRRLRSWKRPAWLQAIHGDPHPGNWLWEGEEIGGLIDFLDATDEGDPRELDFARLLGGTVRSGPTELAAAIESYETAGGGTNGAPPLDAELVRLLECSGVWMRIANWAGILGRAEAKARRTSLSPELSAWLGRLVQDASAWLGNF